MKDKLIMFGFIASITAISWGASKLLSDSVSDYEVIKPRVGVECVVVSRMFNTSVDCWKATGEIE